MTDAEIETRWRDEQLKENGLLDHDQPTETAHNDYTKRMRTEFTPVERQMIRFIVGINNQSVLPALDPPDALLTG